MKDDLKVIVAGSIKILKHKVQQVVTKIEDKITEIEYKAIAAIDKYASKAKEKVTATAAKVKQFVKDNEVYINAGLLGLMLLILGFIFGGAIIGNVGKSRMAAHYNL